MAKIEIYDKPMCCSTGICGPQVDPVLPRFAADLDWLKSQGHQVDRYNLAQQPAAFAANEEVKKILAAESVECLPLILVDGQAVSKADYPTRNKLAELAEQNSGNPTGTGSSTLPVSVKSSDCCGGTDCC
ncbi:UNVERIFIED_CONTAM: hypothetical protein GTU68_013123 [Idotea baltica]|nr:hypothetical protein [Idotea baltica]